MYYCLESVRASLNFNTQGNISVRLPEHDAIVITPSDVPYDAMAPEDIVVRSSALACGPIPRARCGRAPNLP